MPTPPQDFKYEAFDAYVVVRKLGEVQLVGIGVQSSTMLKPSQYKAMPKVVRGQLLEEGPDGDQVRLERLGEAVARRRMPSHEGQHSQRA